MLPRRRPLGLFALESRVAPAAVPPAGPEFRVNTFTSFQQSVPAVAADAAGNFVVAWASEGQDGSGSGVYAQRYSAGGVARGGEFRVNSHTTDRQVSPAVAMDADGDFIIAWQSYNQDGSRFGIYARRFDNHGVPQGGDFRVNTYTTESQSDPAVAADASGNFVVAWASNFFQDGSSSGVYAQRFSNSGAPLGGEFRVNTYTTNSQALPSVAMAVDGDFVVAWQSFDQDLSHYGVFAQRYGGAGAPLGGEFQVNAYTGGAQANPSVAANADGSFVVAWSSPGPDGSGLGVFARRYDTAGAASGNEFQVNASTAGDQWQPAVAVAGNGDFVVAWTGVDDGTNGTGVYARRLSGAGVALSGEFRVNTYTTSSQMTSVVATDADGDFVVAWHSYGQDGDANGVYAQRFNREVPVFGPATGAQLNPAAAADAAGNYLVAWAGFDQDGSGFGVFARHYAVSGHPVGGDFRVNTSTNGSQFNPAVAMDADGDSVVVWESYNPAAGVIGIFAQRYTNAGAPAGGEFPVSAVSGASGDRQLPAVAMDANGDFVVAWVSFYADGDAGGIYARRYDAGGVPLGGEFRVNETTTGTQTDPAVAVDADGDFVVAWATPGQDGSGLGVYARRYSGAGVPLGGEFPVNTYTTGSQADPAVAMSAGGDFVIAWASGATFSPGQDGNNGGISARRYDLAGVPQGDEFRVNTYTTDNQLHPAVAAAADGSFVVAWESSGIFGPGQDGDDAGVYAQRFTNAGLPQGGEFRVNTTTTGDQSRPAVATNAAGDFVVAWSNFDGQPGSLDGILSRQYPVPPKVESVTVNAGAAQRSRVTTLTVTFDKTVAFPGTVGSAFRLARQGGGPVGFQAAAQTVNRRTAVTLSDFAGPESQSGSLADGRYTLTVYSGGVSVWFDHLDGDANGAGGDDFVLVGTPVNGLFRFFGDNDGDGDADAADFGAFRQAFGGVSNLAFDFDGDGDVDAQDYGQFRQRFGSGV